MNVFCFRWPFCRFVGIGLMIVFLPACQMTEFLNFEERTASAHQAAEKARNNSSVREASGKEKPPSAGARKKPFRPQRQLSAEMQKTLPWSRNKTPASSLKPQRRRPLERSVIYQPSLTPALQNWYRDLPFADRTVSLRLDGVPMHALSNLLGSMIPANVGLAKDVADTPLTMRAEGLPWPALFDALARLHGFSIHRQGDFLLVQSGQASDGTQTAALQPAAWRTELFRLSYTQPAALKPIIDALFARQKDKPIVGVDERTRSLIVSAPPAPMQTIAALLEKLDAPLRQIAIEGFIVEADKDFARSFGSRVGIQRLGAVCLSGTLGDEANICEQAGLSKQTGLAVDLAIAGAAGGIGVLLDRRRLRVELTAMERAGKSRIISNPRVLAIENQEAVIFQGDEVPYFTVSENGTQTQFKEAGIKLTVTPTIVGRRQFMLDISVNKDTVDTRIENPPITRRHIQTRLLVRNRAVAVIGGIYFNSELESDVRVPWLHRIPLLGRLFAKTHKSAGVKELLVFISPTMVSASS